ncbi:MAG: hydrogenase maturation protease [Nitrososphaerota archaeon]|nr:hydrogenase maturation protease [Nitrososphaerota archaeon]
MPGSETPQTISHQRDTATSWGIPAGGKVVVVGLGNVYMRDDGVGIYVMAELRKLSLRKDVLICDYTEMELSLVGYFKGASKVIVVDALQSGKPAGTVSRFAIRMQERQVLQFSLHGLQFYEVFDVAIQSGILTCPVIIVGIEPKDCSVGEGLSKELEEALPNVVGEVMKEI